jgi:5'-nucleotidase
MGKADRRRKFAFFANDRCRPKRSGIDTEILMKILLVNDDGINAPGLHALAQALRTVAEVTVVAPEGQMSGVSGAITTHKVLPCKKVYANGEFFGYSIGGTPADCVKIALYDIMPEKPDYVFSGINPGANLSTNVYYSGTCAGATEGLLAGITSVAMSQSVPGFTVDCDYSAAAAIALRWLDLLEKGEVPQALLYNINVPRLPLAEIHDFAYVQLDAKGFPMEYERRVSPRGEVYYWWNGGDIGGGAKAEDSDTVMLKKGYVTVTPLAGVNRTDYSALELLRNKGEPSI